MATLAGGYDTLEALEDALTRYHLEGPHSEFGEPLNNYQQYTNVPPAVQHPGYEPYIALCGHVTMRARGIAYRPRTCGMLACITFAKETYGLSDMGASDA